MDTLRSKVIEHLSAVVFVGASLAFVVFAIGESRQNALSPLDSRIQRYLAIDSLDWGDPLHRALFRDALRDVRHLNEAFLDSLMNAIEDARLAQFSDPLRKLGGGRKELTWSAALDLLPRYLVFVSVFATVLILTYGAARLIAIWRFVLWKQQRSSYLRRYFSAIEYVGVRNAVARVDLLLKAASKGVLNVILFSPAYVIAYSLRTSIDTESVLFLIPLAVISNGVLVSYANRFFELLAAESRKGYVSTALVKGLRGSYTWDHQDGLPLSVLLLPVRRSAGHVFRDIYKNARLQFIPATKEHAAFLITGLVIIEMALNIKGYLCYTLLQHMLYREYDMAIAIVFAIFLAVKVTELCVDIWHALELRKYSNDR